MLMSGQMKKTKTTTNKNPSNLHHKSRDPGDLRGRWRGCDGGRVLWEVVGGRLPGRLAALNFLTWVVVFLKLTSNLHRELLLFLGAYHS